MAVTIKLCLMEGVGGGEVGGVEKKGSFKKRKKKTGILKGILAADWEDHTVWSACVGNASERGKAWGDAAEGGRRGGEPKLSSFSDISDRCDASEGKLINCFWLFIYLKRTKLAGGGELRGGRSHTALMWSQPVYQAAPVKTNPSQKGGKKEEKETKVHTLNIQNKVRPLCDSSRSSCNKRRIWIWISKYVLNNSQTAVSGWTCPCLNTSIVKKILTG